MHHEMNVKMLYIAIERKNKTDKNEYQYKIFVTEDTS